MTDDTITSFFGWLALLNLGTLIFGTLVIMALRDRVAGLHARLFALETAETRRFIYIWLGHYKIATLVFSVMPYLALRLLN